ncbi:sugar diacid recognition domain-containing protein [Evansella sp. AB-P1]|uniref:CdaR family transcriptional regulator n=1 Tax=Evansella sp. AB-P1 TaxID=3037653 RepID=UPI00241F789B|nr:sugar diacid recognition domain-containing protein [Evansella sp. AB-P1]MDG5786167.1 sugar diacid recognition domain-containing protein [Evansella sp. AB-P1]
MSILDHALSQKFIDKTAAYFEHNVNIMDDKGIIIASKDHSRVGDFHEIAFNMLNGKIESGIVNEEQKYLGTKLGVNLFIDYKNKHIGVIGVSGNPETVQVFAEMLKTFIEAMLEYEIHMEAERSHRNRGEQFLHYVLFDEHVDLSIANSMADDLGLSRNLLRVCIVLKNDRNLEYKKVVQALKNCEGYCHDDIVTMARNNDIILFKAIDVNVEEAIVHFRVTIEEYLTSFLEKLSEKKHNPTWTIFVGTLQGSINKYRESYLHAQQLTLQAKGKKGVYFFNDYIWDYYRNLATIKAYDDIFSVYNELFSNEEKKQIAETVEVLRKNNYNVVSSSKELYIHRNTLLFRINKLKEALNIDPIANAAHREFLNELAYYFSRK